MATDSANVEHECDPLNRALHILNQLIGSVLPRAEKPMPISIFKGKYSTLLKHVDDDGVALISHNGKRYVIVAEAHLITLTSSEHPARSVADICRSLPHPSRKVALTNAQLTGASIEFPLPTGSP